MRSARRDCKNDERGAGGGEARETGGRKAGCMGEGALVHECVMCLGDWAAERMSSLVLSVLYSSSLFQVNRLNNRAAHTLE